MVGAGAVSSVRRVLPGVIFLAFAAIPAYGRVGSVADDDTTSKLFNEPYRPDESRHYDTSSSTFTPNAAKQFDLSYADGTVLRGFNGQDVVQVCYSFRTCGFTCPEVPWKRETREMERPALRCQPAHPRLHLRTFAGIS